MSIITISHEAFGHGRAIAERVGKARPQKGYALLPLRGAILREITEYAEMALSLATSSGASAGPATLTSKIPTSSSMRKASAPRVTASSGPLIWRPFSSKRSLVIPW